MELLSLTKIILLCSKGKALLGFPYKSSSLFLLLFQLTFIFLCSFVCPDLHRELQRGFTAACYKTSGSPHFTGLDTWGFLHWLNNNKKKKPTLSVLGNLVIKMQDAEIMENCRHGNKESHSFVFFLQQSHGMAFASQGPNHVKGGLTVLFPSCYHVLWSLMWSHSSELGRKVALDGGICLLGQYLSATGKHHLTSTEEPLISGEAWQN